MLKTNKFIISLACVDKGQRSVFANRMVETSAEKDLILSLRELLDSPLIAERLEMNPNWVKEPVPDSGDVNL